MPTKAYKFTRANRGAPYGVTDYPPVGEWSQIRTPVLCRSGWHVPAPDSLSSWLDVELWEVEVDGASHQDDEKSVHERIRFVRQIQGWEPAVYVEFARFSSGQAERAASYTDAADADAADADAADADAADADAAAADAARYAARYADAADAARYAADAAAADAAAAARYAAAADAARYAAARKEQSDWLRTRLGLDSGVSVDA